MIDLIKKYGDEFLIVLAVMVLAAGVIRWLVSSERNSALTENETPIVLVFGHWWAEQLGEETLAELKNEFENLHEGITINFDNTSYEESRRKLYFLKEENFDEENNETAWDIFALDTLWVPELIQRGVLEPRLSMPDAPLVSFINLLYYNIELLLEAGFSAPPRNRTEFMAQARAVTNAGGNRRGLVMDLRGSRSLYDEVFPWIWASGAVLFPSPATAVNTRQITDSLAFLLSLQEEGLISFTEDGSVRRKLDDFISGNTAFMIASDGDIAYVRGMMGNDAFSVTAVPVPDNYSGRTFYSTRNWSLAVNPVSPNIEAALLFIDFLNEKSGFLSERGNAYFGSLLPRPGNDPHFSRVWDIAIGAVPASEFSQLPWTPLEEIFREELFNLFDGEASPASMAAALQAGLLAALEQ